MDAPPLLPQVDLNADTDAYQPGQLPPTSGEIASADLSSIGSTFKDVENKMFANLENSPIRYNNAAQYLQDSVQALADPQSAGPLLNNKLLTADEANTKYWQPGMPKFSTPIYDQSAQDLGNAQAQANKEDDVLQRANLGTSAISPNNLARDGLSLLDPLTAPLMVMPVLGEEQIAARFGESFLGKLGAGTVNTALANLQFTVADNLLDHDLTSPLGEEKSVGDYLKDDENSLVTGAGFGFVGGVALGAFGRAFSRGSKFFSKLDPVTQEHINDALASDADTPINKVLDLDKNVAEVEAQMGGKAGTAEDRMALMDKPPTNKPLIELQIARTQEMWERNKVDIQNGKRPSGWTDEQYQARIDALTEQITPKDVDADNTRPMTSAELKDAGLPDAAAKVEQQGQDLLAQRVDQVKLDRQEGKLDPKDNEVNPEVEPLIKPDADVKEQSDIVNKQLIATDKMAKDLTTSLENKRDGKDLFGGEPKEVSDADQAEYQKELDELNDQLAAGDEEISRVTGQKSLAQSAAQCALQALNNE